MGISITPPNISELVSTTQTLAASAVYKSDAFYVAEYSKLIGIVQTEHASQASGMSIEYSNDKSAYFRAYSSTISEDKDPLAIFTYLASGPTWYDQTLMESPFSIVPLSTSTNDYTYIGYDARFKGFTIDINTAADIDAAFTNEYWNGTEWSALSITDGTSELTVDGTVSFVPPTDWERNEVNDVLGYFIRIGLSEVTTFGNGAIVASIKIVADEFISFTTDNISTWARVVFENGSTGQDISIIINGRRQ